MTVMQAIEARRSIRHYTQQPVTDEELMAVLEAGRLAPSARNAQSWQFTAVREKSLLERLAVDCNGQQMMTETPAALVVWSHGDRTMGCGQSAATVDCSIALSFMLLRATELGLGSCWLGAFDANAVKRTLALPEDAVVVAVTPLGHPAEQPAPRPRKNPSEVFDLR